MMPITSEKLFALRGSVKKQASPERSSHVLAVEETAARLAGLYCPEKENELRAAALLHDITKELTLEGQLEILRSHGVQSTDELIKSPATLHAITAALIIPDEYPTFASDEIISAVRYHTTGRADMTLAEKIIYIADFIEPNRKHQSCIELARAFFGAEPEKMSESDRLLHLDRIILQSLDSTLAHLQNKGAFISPDTQKAREHLAQQLKSY